VSLARRPLDLIGRILDEPGLIAALRDADAAVLGGLIEHIGLEDAGEIVSLMTTEQLAQVLDEDVWRSDRPGEDETFDSERFALWLEIVLEAGERFAVERLVALDEELVILALDKLILVIDRDALILSMSDAHRSTEADLLDKALESCLYLDLEEFSVISRGGRGWDAVIAVLLEIDKQDHELLRRLLERLCDLAAVHIEDSGGLYDVLTSEEMLESDAAAARADRRAERGHVAPSDARSFLGLARQTPLDEIVDERAADPITRVYFRELGGEGTRAVAAAPVSPWGAARPGELLGILRQAGIVASRPPAALLEGRGRRASGSLLSALRRIRDDDEALGARLLTEVAYLANVLVSGSSFEGRRYRPVEAAEAAIEVCSSGLDHLLGDASPDSGRARELVEREGLVKLFRIGWRLSQGVGE